MSDAEELSFEEARLYTMYGKGMLVAEIADRFKVSVAEIYKRLKHFPDEYEKEKGNLTKLRNARHRRVGALVVDIQLMTLEYYHEKLSDDDTPDKEKQEIRDKLNVISTVAEKAETRADLNEGRATSRVDDMTKRAWSIEELKKRIVEIEDAGDGIDTRSIDGNGNNPD